MDQKNEVQKNFLNQISEKTEDLEDDRSVRSEESTVEEKERLTA